MARQPGSTPCVRRYDQGGFAFRKSRLESLCVLVFGVFVARTVNLSHLACHFPGLRAIQLQLSAPATVFRASRFRLRSPRRVPGRDDGVQAVPWRLTMDRTNWRLGAPRRQHLDDRHRQPPIAIPVCSRRTCSTRRAIPISKERIAILEHVRRLFGVDKIASLLADREFIGDAWLACAGKAAIPFHIRIRSNIKIANTRGRWSRRGSCFATSNPGKAAASPTPGAVSEARKPKA